jgi:alpha-mannosidase
MTVAVHVIAHTHWDREWYLTREEYRLRLADLVDRVLDLMKSDPRFVYFHLDGQTVVLEDYLEVRPEQEERLRRRIAEGRLLVGPWYVMPDLFLVSGEALVRNLALGHRIASRFGAVMAAGYVPDPFGHVAQMPQILSQFGLDSAILWRGFGGWRAEHWWEAPDGSRVLLLHLPREGYGNGARLPLLAPDAMREGAAAVIGREKDRSAFGQVLLMVGTDHLEPHPELTQLVARIAEQPGVRARLSTLPAYVAAVRAATRVPGATALETVRGELRAGEEHAFLLPGVLSSRTYLKQANARVQATLERWAEPLSVLAWQAGEPYPSGLLDYAWKTLLQNHPHDSICGCSIDAVHEENMTRYARAGQTAEGLLERALGALARRVPAAPAGALRFLVVNSDARPYTGVVTGALDVPLESHEPGRAVDPAVLDVPARLFPSAELTAITDSEGRGVAFQVLGAEDRVIHLLSRFAPPWAVRARRLRIALWAKDVPSCGYAAFDAWLGGVRTPVPFTTGVSAGESWLENDRVRVDVNADGTLEVDDRRAGVVLHRCGALLDAGDVGDEYDYCPPPEDRLVTSAEARVLGTAVVEAGPLRGTLRIDLELPLPRAATPDRRGRSAETVAVPVSLDVSIEAASPHVAWTVRLDNRAADHRLRVLFSTGASPVETARADTAFAVVERPARRPEPLEIPREAPVSAQPLQSVVDAGGDRSGVTVASEGLMEYEVLPYNGDWPLALTLLRCVGDLSRDDLATREGHAGPGLRTPGAQCPGPHEFRFAILARREPPAEAEMLASARAFLSPPRLAAPAGGEGRIPPRTSLLEVACPQGAAVLSACKKAEARESIVIRLFNPAAAEARVVIAGGRPFGQAFHVDFLERRAQEIAVQNGRATLTLAPHRIETIELVPAP